MWSNQSSDKHSSYDIRGSVIVGSTPAAGAELSDKKLTCENLKTE